MSEDRQTPIEPAVLQVGERLRQARLARQMSLGDVAGILKISQHQVEAIEVGDWARLPGHTITRGFVRNYARLLQLDPAPLMQSLEQQGLPEPPTLQLPEATTATLPRPGRGRRRDLLTVALGLGAVAVALLAYFIVPADFWHGSQAVGPLKSAVEATAEAPLADTGKPSDIPAEGLTRQAVPLINVGPEAAAEPPPEPKPEGGALRAPVPAPVPAGVTAPVQKAETPVPAVQTAPAAKPLVPQPAAKPEVKVESAPPGRSTATIPARPEAKPEAPAVGSSRLRMRFSGDSWVEVREAGGRVVFSKLARAGSGEEIVGKAPLTVVVGNVSAAQLSFNDRPVDLAPHTKANVAKLTLQ